MLSKLKYTVRKIKYHTIRIQRKIKYNILCFYRKGIIYKFFPKKHIKFLMKCDVDGGLREKSILTGKRLVYPLHIENINIHFFLCHESNWILIINCDPEEKFFLESDVINNFKLVAKKSPLISLKNYYEMECNKYKEEVKYIGDNIFIQSIKSIYNLLVWNEMTREQSENQIMA